MVPLVPVPSEFAGRVLVAKLGSAGILAELRGVSRIYPTLNDAAVVWVEATEFADARPLGHRAKRQPAPIPAVEPTYQFDAGDEDALPGLVGLETAHLAGVPARTRRLLSSALPRTIVGLGSGHQRGSPPVHPATSETPPSYDTRPARKPESTPGRADAINRRWLGGGVRRRGGSARSPRRSAPQRRTAP